MHGRVRLAAVVSPTMTDDTPSEAEELPPYKIEPARSSRSGCKGCRRKIAKDALRLGVMIEGPFGAGYLWFHLNCAAKRRPEDLEEAYAQQAWPEGCEVPPIEELRKLADVAAKEKAEKKEPPYGELAPSGRSKCKQCGETIDKGTVRVVLSREVHFYNQVRSGPINVHPACVQAALDAEDNATETDSFEAFFRQRTEGIDAALIDETLSRIGPVE